MKLRNPRLVRLAGRIGAGIIRLWLGTVHLKIHAEDGQKHPRDPRQHRCIYAFWHEALLFPTRVSTPVRILISQHADGELIATACQSLGFGVVRGSTTRGGAAALLDMMRQGSDEHLAITPDGPKGPRRQVQQGLIFAASLMGLPIVPVGFGCSWGWRAKSWDRFLLPGPFSTACAVVAAPILLPDRLNRAGLEWHRQRVEQEMLRVTAAAEAWAETGIRPGARDRPTVAQAA